MIRKLAFLAAAGLLMLFGWSDRARAQVIDCDDPITGPDALQDAINSGQYLIQFTGTCNEVLGIFRDDVHLLGSNPNPALNIINGGATVAVAQDIKFENLKIQGEFLNIVNGAFVFVYNSIVEDTDHGVFIARNSGAILDGMVIGPALIDDGNQSCVPLCIGENSHVRMLNSTVTGATDDPVDGGAVIVYRDASLLLRGGNSISNSGTQPVISVSSESTVRQDDPFGNGTDLITATGSGLAVEAFRTSLFDTRQAVINGDISIVQHSFMNAGSTVFGGDPSLLKINGEIELSEDSALTVSSPLVTINGDITCADDESSAVGSFAGTGINSCSGFDTEIVRDDGTAQFLVEESSPTTADRTLVQLTNNGRPKVRLSNTASGVNWEVGIGVADAFAIRRGKNDYRFNKGGRVLWIIGGAEKYRFNTNGSMVIAGTLTENSDVEAKRHIVPVDGGAVLDQVAALPVSTWSYKDDEAGTRHVGPMAQDFHAAFGLGEDDTHVAPRDVAGVALAAVKALHEVVRQKDAQIVSLRANHLALQKRLEALERKLAR